MAIESHDRWHHNFFSVDHFIPKWPSKIFRLIGCGVLHMQLWRHNEGTYDVIKILIPHEEYLLRAKFQFSPWCGFRDTEVQGFSVVPIWLPHHVTYDVITIIRTFYMSCRTNGENFVSIRRAVVEKNTKVLCRQTDRHIDKQTNKQTDKQTDPNVIPSTLVRVNIMPNIVFGEVKYHRKHSFWWG